MFRELRNLLFPLFNGRARCWDEVLAYVGRIHNLKDLKDPRVVSRGFCRDTGNEFSRILEARESRGKSHSRQIGKILGKCLQKSANFWEKLANFWDFSEKSASFREIGKFLGNVSKSSEIHFPGATFRDTGNDFPGEGQKPPGQNPNSSKYFLDP